MNIQMPVSDIMTKDLLTVGLKDELTTAEAIFKKHKIRHLPVVSGDKIVGMLSYNDLLRISFADAIDEFETDIDTTVYNMFTIEQVMVKKVVSVRPTNTLKEVAEIFTKNEFHALPVTEGDKLVGIVTTTDIIKQILK